ncbi:MAG: addiction module protein [Gemmatimonadales bacterium]|nr:addiction module protein [Gemmatimonadales bacterium]MDZ4390969.1 addiction module protein [Gemmatimonadales bacterium]
MNSVSSRFWQEMTMTVSLKSLGLEKLSIAERLLLVEEIWDSISAATPLTDPQRAELDRRLADHEANPDNVVSWGEVQSSIRDRLNR